MTADELNLWERLAGRSDEAARRELILFYLGFVDVLAKRIARNTGANWEDLRQDGVIGLIKGIARFDPGQGVPFSAFARNYVCGAIYDSSELTREMTRRQHEIYSKIRQTENELTQILQRNPTIQEVAEQAGLTTEQIRNALDARGLAFAGGMPNAEDAGVSVTLEAPRPERTVSLLQELARLNVREQQIIRLYYWEDLPQEEIAQRLGLTTSNVSKIRQRAIGKLRKRLK